MWMWTPPSSTIRRASAAYSAGVYGIAGHWLAVGDHARDRAGDDRGVVDAHPLAPDRSIPARRRCAACRSLDALAGRHLQAPADRLAGLTRIDHVVDHVVAGRTVDVDQLAVVGDQLGPPGLGVLGLGDLLAEDDLDRALGAHDADLRRRPGDDQVGLVGAAAHHVVAGAVGLAQHDRDLGDGRVGGRVQQLGAVADDPRLLGPRPDHEPGHVHQVDERDPEGVAEVDEPRRLVGRVVVEDPAQLAGLVGDDPGRAAAEASQAGDHRPAPPGLEVEPLPVVDDPADHLIHVVRAAVGVGQHVEQLLVGAVDRIGGLGAAATARSCDGKKLR